MRVAALVMTSLAHYAELLGEIKSRIQAAQMRAAFAANSELLRLYWQVGHLLDERQQQEGWGAAVIPRLARDLANELPEIKGFSERNIRLMLQFYRAYPALLGPGGEFVPQPVAQMQLSSPAQLLQPLVAQLPWAHNMLLLQALKDDATRAWYASQALSNGWSRNVLKAQIDTSAHERQGAAVTNFAKRLPAPQSEFAQQLLKDPYIFDFLTLEPTFHERELSFSFTSSCARLLWSNSNAATSSPSTRESSTSTATWSTIRCVSRRTRPRSA